MQKALLSYGTPKRGLRAIRSCLGAIFPLNILRERSQLFFFFQCVYFPVKLLLPTEQLLV